MALKLPKVRKPVELLMDGDITVQGEVYLVPACMGRNGERVVDLLSLPDRFIPVACIDGRRLVNKDKILMVRVPHRDDAGIEPPETAANSSRVTIELAGPRPRRKISGTVRWNSREDRPRFVDHANDVAGWIAVEDPEGPVLVACRHILHVFS